MAPVLWHSWAGGEPEKKAEGREGGVAKRAGCVLKPRAQAAARVSQIPIKLSGR